MGQTQATVTYNTFIKGLITEASAINFPPDASYDEDNMVLFKKGNRRRRLGVDYVAGLSLSTATFSMVGSSAAPNYSYYYWEAVAGDGSLNLHVIQLGSTLYFYSDALALVDDINLADFDISGASNIDRDKVKFTSTRGKLVVVGKQLTPFYVTYAAGAVTGTAINIEIRDFEGIDDSLDVDENPASLSDAHNYNLKNQGWLQANLATDPITAYFTSTTSYPANNQVWFVGRDTDDNFSPTILDKQTFGNTPAPKGHYLLNPFNRDRSTASGIAGLSTEAYTVRPEAVESFAGRIWYAGLQAEKINGEVYFSQVLNSKMDNLGKCYQEADPTAEDDSLLVDDDGGVIPVSKVGRILGLKAVQDSLLIFGDNGVWAISGPDGYFRATDFTLYQVTSVGLLSKDSILEVEGRIFYWSKKGIYALVRDESTGRLIEQSLTDTTIQTLYDAIPTTTKQNVQAIYDDKRRQIIWLYNDLSDTTYKRNKMLMFDISTNAFSKFSISPLASDSPFIIGACEYDNSTAWYSSSIAYITFVPSSGSFKLIFSQFKERSFVDWKTKNSVGISYDSYLETGFEYGGDLMRDKQINYMMFYFERTEENYVAIVDDGYRFDYPSSCKFRTKWEWADTSGSNKWSRLVEVYRLKRFHFPDEDDLSYETGFPVVVSKEKVRGSGRALKFRFESTAGKDFNLLGWAVHYTGETDV